MFLISDCKRVIFSLNNRDKTKANISFWGLDLFHLNWLCRFFSLAAYGCYAELYITAIMNSAQLWIVVLQKV